MIFVFSFFFLEEIISSQTRSDRQTEQTKWFAVVTCILLMKKEFVERDKNISNTFIFCAPLYFVSSIFYRINSNCTIVQIECTNADVKNDLHA